MSIRLNLVAFTQQDYPFPMPSESSAIEKTALVKIAQYLQVLCTQTGTDPEKVFPLELMATNDSLTAFTLDKKLINTRFFALIEEIKAESSSKAVLNDSTLKRLSEASEKMFVNRRRDLLANAKSEVDSALANFQSTVSRLNERVAIVQESRAKLAALEEQGVNAAYDLSKIVPEILKSGFFRFDKLESTKQGCFVYLEIGPIHWRHKAKLKEADYDVDFGTMRMRWEVGGNITLGTGKNNLARGSMIFPYASTGTPWKSICTGNASSAYGNHLVNLEFVQAFSIIEEIFSKDTYGVGYSHPKDFMRGDTIRTAHEVTYFNGHSILMPLECSNIAEAMRVNDFINSLGYEDGNWMANERMPHSREKVMRFYNDTVKGKFGDPVEEWKTFAKRVGLYQEPAPAAPEAPIEVTVSTPVEKKKRASRKKPQAAPAPQAQEVPPTEEPYETWIPPLQVPIEQVRPGMTNYPSDVLDAFRYSTPQPGSIFDANGRAATARELAQLERAMRMQEAVARVENQRVRTPTIGPINELLDEEPVF